MTDKEIIKNIIRQDQQAFKLLVEKYQDMVFKACHGLLHNYEDAEDIAQEVFIEAFQSLKYFRQESKLSTWLYRIAINKSINQIKKNKRRNIRKTPDFFTLDENTQLQENQYNNEESADKIIEKQERAKILYSAINKLSERQKIAFTLNKLDSLSYKEISEIMDLSISSVESLIHRAKKNLQQKLFDYYKKSSI